MQPTMTEMNMRTVRLRLERAWNDGHPASFSLMQPRYQWSLCAARLLLGDYSDWRGWEQRSPWTAAVWAQNPYGVPRWDGKPTPHLLLVGEQHIGDDVLYASCLPDAIAMCGADAVTVEVDARLVPALGRSFAVAARAYPDRGAAGVRAARRATPPAATAWLPLGDLLPLFRQDAAGFTGKPYLVPDPQRVAAFEPFRGHTGISWRGHNGACPWQAFDGRNTVSLQYDQQAEEGIATPGIDLRNDIEGVMALISVLERVVTVSTTVAHLACALGVETHVVLAPADNGSLNWRWGMGARVPWYGSARIYRTLSEWCQSGVAQQLWSDN